jgi:uncharacterized protein YfbU (UPF0304 family)
MPGLSDEFPEIALGDELLQRIDAWRAGQGMPLSRSQAVAALVNAGLGGQASPALTLGDKLILSILCDVSRKVEAKGAIDPDFLQEAIKGGHNWAIEWEHPSLAHGHTNSQNTVDMVSRVLSMWRLIEDSFAMLSAEDQGRVRADAGLAGPPRFPGWHSGQEANYKSTSRFLTDQMAVFPMFAGRSAIESGRPVIARYKRMLECLAGFASKGSDQRLDADELSGLLAIE